MKTITKGFTGVRVLHGVDFELSTGEVMALMGENGAGKSTLMKILAGVYDDWEGRILLGGRERRFRNTREAEKAGIAIIYQELNLVPELTVAENIFLGREPIRWGGMVDYARMNDAAKDILMDLHFEIPVTTPVAALRIGHQQLVEIAKALSMDARILVMDEPTSALSESEIRILFSVVRKLKKRSVSIIYISHRIGEVFEIADRITVLRDGCLVGVHGVEDVSRPELIKMMVGREFDQFFVKQGRPEEDVFFRVRNLNRRSAETGKKHLVKDITFEVRKGERFGIAGLLGSGRTELLESLFGVDSNNTSGHLEIEGESVRFANTQEALSAGMALITEDRKGNGLVMSMNVKHNMTLAALRQILRFMLISKKKEKSFVENYIDRLSIDVTNPENSMETFSGGNQQKVLLAKWLATQPKVLLLDEPTRGVDVGAKHEIYLLLSELTKQGISVIMTSSELPELLSLCDRIMVLREGKVSALFEGDEATQEKILDAAAPVG
jgi:ABC-type sugar transport system ATPase subunit